MNTKPNEAAIAAMQAQQGAEPVAWQPIETAPSSAGYYLCWCPVAPPQSINYQTIRFKDGEWWTGWKPSHWQLLPGAPR